MRPQTDLLPKALIPVRGRPFAFYQLDWLAAEGVSDVVYCIGYRGDMLRHHVGDGGRWGLRVSYVDEGEQLRGTGGALRFAADEGALERSFLVLYADSYLQIRVQPVWAAFQATSLPALMTVYRNDGQWDKSNVVYQDGRVLLYDKEHAASDMSYIDYGLTLWSRSVIEERLEPGAVCDLAVLLRDLSNDGQLAGFEAKGRFFEVGSLHGLRDLEAHLAENRVG